MDFSAGSGAFSEGESDTPLGAPNIIPSWRREAPELDVFLSGGGSWAFFHYGMLKQLLTDMLLRRGPFGEANIALIVGTSGGAIPAYVLGNALNGPGSREDNLQKALKAMKHFKFFFEMGAAFRPDMWLAYYWSNFEYQLRQAIHAAHTSQPNDYSRTRVLVNATRVDGQSEKWTPEFFVDDQVDLDAVIASCSVKGMFPGVKDGDDLLIDGGYTYNPPGLPALEALGVNQRDPRHQTILSLTECPLLADTQTCLLGDEAPHGRTVFRQMMELRRFYGRDNFHICTMFNRTNPPGEEWTSESKAKPVPKYINPCHDSGAAALTALAGKLSPLWQGGKCAPA